MCYPIPYLGSVWTERDKDVGMKIPSYHKHIVGFLYIKDGNKFKTIGTAFFLIQVEADIGFYYLITCKHVVKPWLEKGRTIFARFNRSDKYDVDYIQLENDWVYHKDKTVDLAVLSYKPPKAGTYHTFWGALDAKEVLLTDGLLDSLGRPLSEGVDIVFIGLFGQYTGYQRNFPCFRNGKIALITEEKVKGAYGDSDYIFVECQMYPGFSGSPMFVGANLPGGRRYFVAGVMAASYPEKQKVLVAPGKEETYTHFGVSISVPAQKIADIIYGDKLMKQREEKIGASNFDKDPVPMAMTEPIEESEEVFTRDDFFDALGKATRPIKPESKKKKD